QGQFGAKLRKHMPDCGLQNSLRMAQVSPNEFPAGRSSGSHRLLGSPPVGSDASTAGSGGTTLPREGTMETRMSRIIGMVVRVVQFCLEHVSPVEGHTEVVGRLEALLTRMQILAAQESQGRRQARAKVSGKEKYKRELHRQLKFLSLVARGRAAEN